MPTDAVMQWDWREDSPWHRLPWTLPTAIAIVVLSVGIFLLITGKPGERLPEPQPIDAQIVELPPPAPPPPLPSRHSLARKAAPKPVRKKSVVTPTRPVIAVTHAVSARPILRPMPVIPDELRQDALSTEAVALFHVAVDGSATVELVKPTPFPRLNRLLLNALQQWRFTPAIKNGVAVPSTKEIVVKVDVH